MKITVRGAGTHVATGGRGHVTGRPAIVFLHGSGFNHMIWALQTRALAYDGWNVIAPDLPGHGFSSGDPIEGIEAQAAWVLELMDALDCPSAVIAGHSQGGLIALDMARQAPERVTGLIFIGSSAAIPVNEKLIETARDKPETAFRLMVSWGFGPGAHLHENTWPGASHIFFGIQTMRMQDRRALATDLVSCNAYQRGADVAAAIRCPALVILAELDRMTPAKAGRALAAAIPGAELHVIARSGHTLPTEKPREVNALIRDFLKRTAGNKAA